MIENIALTEGVYYILLCLNEPMHGYGIMQKVSLLSNNRLNLAAGTLYGALSAMLEKGWINALKEETNSRKKEYMITEDGIKIIKNEISRLRELLLNGEEIYGGN